MPAVPVSRASVMTFQAPAPQLGLDHLDPAVGRDDGREVLRADLAEHHEVLRQAADVLELGVVGQRDGAVGDLDVLQGQVADPAAPVVELLLDWQTSQKVPPSTTGTPASR